MVLNAEEVKYWEGEKSAEPRRQRVAQSVYAVFKCTVVGVRRLAGLDSAANQVIRFFNRFSCELFKLLFLCAAVVGSEKPHDRSSRAKSTV